MLNAIKKTNKLKIEKYKLIGLLRIYTFLFGDFYSFINLTMCVRVERV